jgi:Na+/H+-dicarboxylate symporter
MFTTPMIFAIVLSGFSGINDTNMLRRVGKQLLSFSLAKTALFIIAGMFLGHILGEFTGINQVTPGEASGSPSTISEIF